MSVEIKSQKSQRKNAFTLQVFACRIFWYCQNDYFWRVFFMVLSFEDYAQREGSSKDFYLESASMVIRLLVAVGLDQLGHIN